MEERGGKTIMCSVLFLDIVEYSKRSVSGQISLKDRFNSYLSAAISGVPIDDRIILDTGDGAAINFLGDVEDALKAALSLRESILNEGPNQEPPLLVRAGINLGPVRLVRDINSQPNIVGDGINVAQRIMGFADADQILVSRSYYDAVSRLSPQYTGMFSYQGSRTDKHVREHEVYAIGHLGEKTAELIATNLHEIQKVGLVARIAAGWNDLAHRCDNAIAHFRGRFAQAGSGRRALYVGAIALPVALIATLVLRPVPDGEAPALPGADQLEAASGVEAAPAVAGADAVVPPAESMAPEAGDTKVATKPEAKKTVQASTDVKKVVEGKTVSKKTSEPAMAAQPKPQEAEPADKKNWLEAIKGVVEPGTGAYISIRCQAGTQMFVDGTEKGKVVPEGLTVTVAPGKHKVIVTSKNGALYAQDVVLELGKTVQIKPNFCE